VSLLSQTWDRFAEFIALHRIGRYCQLQNPIIFDILYSG
jgi:hypothetical protein